MPSFDCDFCKLFVNGEKETKDIVENSKKICFRVLGEKSSYVDYYCGKSDDLNPSQSNEFLFWPCIIDIDYIAKKKEKSEFVQIIQNLIDELKKNNFDVVASCNFEELLTGTYPWKDE